jgi:hypothetical protein
VLKACRRLRISCAAADALRYFRKKILFSFQLYSSRQIFSLAPFDQTA